MTKENSKDGNEAIMNKGRRKTPITHTEYRMQYNEGKRDGKGKHKQGINKERTQKDRNSARRHAKRK